MPVVFKVMDMVGEIIRKTGPQVRANNDILIAVLVEIGQGPFVVALVGMGTGAADLQ